MSETKDPMIAALLREREGYAKFGKSDRLKAVDAELKRRGYEEPKKAAPKKSEPKKDEPKGRATPASKQATADASKPASKSKD